jgi:oxygen-independent coproporphyrinogen-3 oxidase
MPRGGGTVNPTGEAGSGFPLSPFAPLSLPSGVHLYLHVPFCARRCSYCDFAIAVRRDTPSAEYADRILAEWRHWRGYSRWAASREIATVYFGGGTPSRLHPDALTRILASIHADLAIAAGAEITLEANPEDVTADSARAWSRAGINRVSLGVQSFDPAVLAWMHRTHTATQVPEAVSVLRDAGITNLSLDLIYALPASLARDWSSDLAQVLALKPPHLSLYGLTVEAHTPLGRWVDRGQASPAPDERYAEEFLFAHTTLEAAGYRHYEVSNYGLPGREARHNSAYWRRAPYLGLGPSAHSATGDLRWWNLRDWAAWSRAIEVGEPAVAGEERLSPASRRVEDLYLGLRTDAGIPLDGVDAGMARAWREAGWAVEREGRLTLTAEGWLRLDSVVGAAIDDRVSSD